MRKLLLALALALVPGMAAAQSIEGADTLPVPREMTGGISGYRVAAISLGAVAGVALANYLTGGMLTPLMTLGYAGGEAAAAGAGAMEGGAMLGAGGMSAAGGQAAYGAAMPMAAAAEGTAVAVMNGASWMWTASQVGLTAASAYVGGTVGSWVPGIGN